MELATQRFNQFLDLKSGQVDRLEGGCAYEATVGDTANAVLLQGQISVSGDSDSDNLGDVFVQTFEQNGTVATVAISLVRFVSIELHRLRSRNPRRGDRVLQLSDILLARRLTVKRSGLLN